ncbi:MAG: hypothetical protein KGJ86_19310, partial [Chloroflexota bacterium]|nr:hypothetical protein [Chloroflexota bacterium]
TAAVATVDQDAIRRVVRGLTPPPMPASEAAQLVAPARKGDREAAARIVDRLTRPRLSEDVEMLLVVQAAMIAGSGATAEQLLRWVIWDEWGQPLPMSDADAELPAGPMLRPVPPVEHVTPLAGERREEHQNAA